MHGGGDVGVQVAAADDDMIVAGPTDDARRGRRRANIDGDVAGARVDADGFGGIVACGSIVRPRDFEWMLACN